MPLTRNAPRRVNALGGKRPQATGIAFTRKNGDRKLATSKGSTSNFGGNTKYGMFPNVGMNYLFQNKYLTSSMFYTTTTPAQATPALIGSPIRLPVGTSVTFTYINQTDDYYTRQKDLDDNSFSNDERQASTNALNDWTDGYLSNREFYTELGRQNLGVEFVDNPTTVDSKISVILDWNDDEDDKPNKLQFSLYGEENETWEVKIQRGTSAPVTKTMNWEPVSAGFFPDFLRPYPIGFTGSGFYELDLTIGETSASDIVVGVGSGGTNANGDAKYPVSIVGGPLKITITKKNDDEN